MRITDQSWMQLEAVLRREDRAGLPLGSTGQHAYLSLSTDAILAERVAEEATRDQLERPWF
jgi:creatinine amidohydrolase